MSKCVWEILIPTTKHPFFRNHYGVVNWDAACIPCTFQDHMLFDEFVKGITGGLTIHAVGKGKWDDEYGREYHENVIPVKVVCTPEEFADIMTFAVKHYRQKSVLGYLISSQVTFQKHEDW